MKPGCLAAPAAVRRHEGDAVCTLPDRTLRGRYEHMLRFRGARSRQQDDSAHVHLLRIALAPDVACVVEQRAGRAHDGSEA